MTHPDGDQSPTMWSGMIPDSDREFFDPYTRLAPDATISLPEGGLPLTDEAGNVIGWVTSVSCESDGVVVSGTVDDYSTAALIQDGLL